MSEQVERAIGQISDSVAYLITATLDGASVQAIAAVGKERDYAMSAEDRERELLRVIRPLAVERFGDDATPDVSWVKSTHATLKMGEV